MTMFMTPLAPSTLEALRAIAQGKRVQPDKHIALRRASLIRVIGHGKAAQTFLTGRGLEAIQAAGDPPNADV